MKSEKIKTNGAYKDTTTQQQQPQSVNKECASRGANVAERNSKET